MHPPLIPELHPMCKGYMEALMRCHKEHNVSKWWGACNDPHDELIQCLAREKKELRSERQARAKERFRQKRQEDIERLQKLEQQQQQQGQGSSSQQS